MAVWLLIGGAVTATCTIIKLELAAVEVWVTGPIV